MERIRIKPRTGNSRGAAAQKAFTGRRMDIHTFSTGSVSGWRSAARSRVDRKAATAAQRADSCGTIGPVYSRRGRRRPPQGRPPAPATAGARRHPEAAPAPAAGPGGIEFAPLRNRIEDAKKGAASGPEPVTHCQPNALFAGSASTRVSPEPALAVTPVDEEILARNKAAIMRTRLCIHPVRHNWRIPGVEAVRAPRPPGPQPYRVPAAVRAKRESYGFSERYGKVCRS